MGVFGKRKNKPADKPKPGGKKAKGIGFLDLGPATGVTLPVDEKMERIKKKINEIVKKINK